MSPTLTTILKWLASLTIVLAVLWLICDIAWLVLRIWFGPWLVRLAARWAGYLPAAVDQADHQLRQDLFSEVQRLLRRHRR